MHENTKARRQALQVLYQDELMQFEQEQDASIQHEPFVVSQCPQGVEENELVGESVHAYAETLSKGVEDNMAQIDAWIAAVAENWTIGRMPIVDRNIIRIAAYEIAFVDDMPTGVAINEAVEVAKAFGGDESPKFVNGVLGRIASLVESGEAAHIAPLSGAQDAVPGDDEGLQQDAADVEDDAGEAGDLQQDDSIREDSAADEAQS